MGGGGRFLVALAMMEDEVSVSYFLAFHLEEAEALDWVADQEELAELSEELEKFRSDEKIDWIGGHVGVAAGIMLLRTRRVAEFGGGLPDVLVGIKIRKEGVRARRPAEEG